MLKELSTLEGLENDGTAKTQLEFEMRLHSAEESLNKTQRLLAEKTEENKRLKEQLDQLTSIF